MGGQAIIEQRGLGSRKKIVKEGEALVSLRKTGRGEYIFCKIPLLRQRMPQQSFCRCTQKGKDFRSSTAKGRKKMAVESEIEELL